LRLTRATAADSGADLGDGGEEEDPGAEDLEGVGDRQVHVLRLPRPRRRGGRSRVALARPLPLPCCGLLHSPRERLERAQCTGSQVTNATFRDAMMFLK